mmetsp:Transcript_17278/g.41610  ORF Transcript_17278/g.41610 Transcript_17278/m.41610 type:complete len:231 (-) Transcript_17278:1015-1707(-)
MTPKGTRVSQARRSSPKCCGTRGGCSRSRMPSRCRTVTTLWRRSGRGGPAAGSCSSPPRDRGSSSSTKTHATSCSGRSRECRNTMAAPSHASRKPEDFNSKPSSHFSRRKPSSSRTRSRKPSATFSRTTPGFSPRGWPSRTGSGRSCLRTSSGPRFSRGSKAPTRASDRTGRECSSLESTCLASSGRVRSTSRSCSRAWRGACRRRALPSRPLRRRSCSRRSRTSCRTRG